MDRLAVLDEINRLLDDASDETINTSMRLPKRLRDAAALAVRHLDVAPSTTALTAAALRHALETVVMEAALQAHYALHPHAQPTLAETALALAEQDGSPFAGQPDVIHAAADAVLVRRADADAYDVLLWAEAQQALVA